MESIKILPASEGLGFTYTKNGQHKVSASIQPNVKVQWSNIFENQVFQKWVMRYTHNNTYQLVKVHIENCSDDCQYVEMVVDAVSDENKTIQQKLILSPTEINILIMLPYKAFKRDTCLLVREESLMYGMEDNFVIPKGHFIGQKKSIFQSPHSQILKSCLGLTIEKDQLIPLSEKAAKQIYQNDILNLSSTTLSQRCNTEKVLQNGPEYYLYYCNIDITLAERLVEAISKAKDGNPEMRQYNQLKVVPLKNLWKSTMDTAAMCSAFLYSNLKNARQISIAEFSNCRGPDADSIPEILRSVETVKSTPMFSKVSSLCPTSKNINIRVKVVEPINKKDKTKNSWEMLVGDDGAIASLRLSEKQLNIPDVVNTPLFIRNAHVIMDNGHMHLAVGRWGKISVATNEEMEQFNFSVGTVKNMSEVEYELVIIEDSNGLGNADKSIDERNNRFNRNRRPPSKQVGKQDQNYDDADTMEHYRMSDDREGMKNREQRKGNTNMFQRRRNRFRGRGGRSRQDRQPVLVN